MAMSCCLLIGCSSESEFTHVPISGEVTLQKKPVAAAMIRFVPVQGEPGQNDSVTMITEGRFVFDDTNGPSPGEHHVVITPIEPEMNEAMQAMQEGDRDPLKSKTIPVRYQSTGQLSANVSPSANEPFVFELSKR